MKTMKDKQEYKYIYNFHKYIFIYTFMKTIKATQ